MLIVKCRRCGKILKEKGALIITPPTRKLKSMDEVLKIHICRDCWMEDRNGLLDWIRSKDLKTLEGGIWISPIILPKMIVPQEKKKIYKHRKMSNSMKGRGKGER